MEKQRIEGIDIAKGIGILLVYIGHVPPCKFVVRFIYNFHMPLFFFLSGIFLDEKKYGIKDFIESRCKSLLIPFGFFIAFAIALHLIPDFDFMHPSMGAIGGAALWFLPVLFFSELVVYAFWKLTDSKLLRIFFSMLLFLVAIGISKIGIMLPFSLQAIPMAAGFYSLGSLVGKEIKKYYVTGLLSNNYIIAFACLFVLIVCATIFNSNTNMYYGLILLNGLGIIVALVGIIMIIILSKGINARNTGLKKFFLWLGQNSLVIFGTHLAFKDLFIRLFGEMTIENPYYYVLGNVVMMGGALLCVLLINKKLPWVLGKF